MSFFLILKVEFLKLCKKVTTRLLLLLFLVPVIFGIGMCLGLNFLVPDGDVNEVEAVGQGLTGLEFVVEMLGQSSYILYLVVIIIAAISFSSELEQGQMKSQIIRMCSRMKILLAKYMALVFVIGVTFIAYIIWSFIIYLLFVENTGFANGQLWDAQWWIHIVYIVFTFISVTVSIGFTYLVGSRLKTFPCFAISYIIWFASQYTDFMKNIKLLIPNNMPDYILEQEGDITFIILYTFLYAGYCFICFLIAGNIFQRIDIKS